MGQYQTPTVQPLGGSGSALSPATTSTYEAEVVAIAYVAAFVFVVAIATAFLE